MIEERGEVYLKVSNRKNIILLCVRDKCTNIDYVPCKIPVNVLLSDWGKDTIPFRIN